MSLDPITATVHVSFWKSISYIPFIGGCMFLCDVLYLNCSLLAFLIMLMFLDFVSGWYKSYQLNIPITYKRLVAGMYAKVIVFVILITLGLIIASVQIVSPKVFDFFNMMDYMSGITLFMILNEGYSIFGNFIAGRNKEELKEIDFMTMIIRKIRDIIEKKLDEKTK